MNNAWRPTKTELIEAIESYPNRRLEILCMRRFRLGELVWLEGDTYTLTVSQFMERFYTDLPGFLAHFQFTKSFDEIFPKPLKIERALYAAADSFQVETIGDGIVISEDFESVYLDRDSEEELLAILLQRKAEREAKHVND